MAAKNGSKVKDLVARRPGAETMDVQRTAADLDMTEVEREDARRFQLAKSKARCPHCGQPGSVSDVTHTDGDVRHVKCRGCTRTYKIVAVRNAPARTAAMTAETGADSSQPDTESEESGEGETPESAEDGTERG